MSAKEQNLLRDALERHAATHRGQQGVANIRMRDLLVQLLSGRLFAFQAPDGRQIWPAAARQEISDWLDWNEPRYGSMMVRTPTGWRPTVNCQAGAVLVLAPSIPLEDFCPRADPVYFSTQPPPVFNETVEQVLLVTDSFTDANGTLLSNHTPDQAAQGVTWTAPAGVTIQNNRLEFAANDLVAWILFGDPGMQVSADWFCRTGARDAVLARAGSSDTFYMLTVRQPQQDITLHRAINGNFVFLGSVSHTFNVGTTYNVKLEAEGSTVRGYIDGQIAIGAVDGQLPTQTGGGLKRNTSVTSPAFDNFKIEEIPDPAASEGDPVLDTFTGPDGTLLSNHAPDQAGQGVTWTAPAGATIQGNKLQFASDNLVAWIQFGQANMAVSADWFCRAGARDPVFARAGSSGTFYMLTVRQPQQDITLHRAINGNFVFLGSVSQAFNVGTTYNVKLEAEGSTIRGYIDGQLVITRTDTILSSQKGGGVGRNTSVTSPAFDNFRIDPIGA